MTLYIVDETVSSSDIALRTAVELQLPWKRNTGRAPMSYVEKHSYADDTCPPVRSEEPSWIVSMMTTDPPWSPSSEVVTRSSPFRQMPTVSCLKSQNSESQLYRPDLDDDTPAGVEKDSEDKDEEVSGGVEDEGVLPWRRRDDNVVPRTYRYRHDDTSQQQSTSPSAAGALVTGDCSQSVDALSMHPHASCQSFRLSEAESKHSAGLFQHQHHVMEMNATATAAAMTRQQHYHSTTVGAGQRTTTDNTAVGEDDESDNDSVSDDDDDDDILSSLEPIDSRQRIQDWLNSVDVGSPPPPSDTAYLDTA